MGANDNMINLAGNLSPELMAEQQQLTRQQQLANLLSQQGMQQLPTGSMVSGRFVPTSPFQYLAQYGNIAAGNYLGKKADEEAIKLAQRIRQQYASEAEQYQKLREGTPAQAGGIVGPNGQMTTQTTADMYGPNMELNPQYKQVAPTAAVAPNVRAANLYGATVATNPVLQQFAQKEMFKGPDWKDVKQVNRKTGETELWRYDANSQSPRDTFQFLGVEKGPFTPAELLHLNDQGIGTGQFGNYYGGGSPATTGGNAPIVGGGTPSSGNLPAGGNVNVGNRPAVGGTAPSAKPVSATNVNEDALVKTYGYDPFKPPPMPPMKSGQNARAWNANLYKELEGTAANTVTGATTYVDALEKYKNYVDKLTARDLANPQVRNQLNSLYATVKLTGKEAANLGVLNGGDEKILEAVVPNYSDIFVTKNTVKKILDEQKEFGSTKIVATYRTAQKPVPENMRKYIVVPKIAEETAVNTPKATAATARAVLNGRQIEVRGNNWVDSKTGEIVK